MFTPPILDIRSAQDQIGDIIYSCADMPASKYLRCDVPQILSQTTYASLYAQVGILADSMQMVNDGTFGVPYLTAVSYLSGLDQVVGFYSTTRAYTTDGGVTWTENASIVANKVWYSSLWIEKYNWMVLTGNTSAIYTSPDATTFTQRTSATTNTDLSGLAYSPELDILVLGSVTVTANTTRFQWSDDGGATWNAGTTPDESRSMTRPVWSSSLGVFVSTGTSGTGNRFLYSHDGKTWLNGSAGTVNYEDIAFLDSVKLFVAVSNSRHAYSSDGITWTEPTGTLPATAMYKVQAVPELKCLVTATTDGSLYATYDGKTWQNFATCESAQIRQSAWVPTRMALVMPMQTGTNRNLRSVISYDTGTEFYLPERPTNKGAIPYIRYA